MERVGGTVADKLATKSADGNHALSIDEAIDEEREFLNDVIGGT